MTGTGQRAVFASAGVALSAGPAVLLALTGRHDLPPRFSVVRAMTFTTAPGLYLAATSD